MSIYIFKLPQNPKYVGDDQLFFTLNKDNAEMGKRVVSLEGNMDANQICNLYTIFLCPCPINSQLFRQQFNKYLNAKCHLSLHASVSIFLHFPFDRKSLYACS